jgi:hypothetical protein
MVLGKIIYISESYGGSETYSHQNVIAFTVTFKTVGASPILPYAATFPQKKWISTNTQFLREIELGLDKLVSYLSNRTLPDSF